MDFAYHYILQEMIGSEWSSLVEHTSCGHVAPYRPPGPVKLNSGFREFFRVQKEWVQSFFGRHLNDSVGKCNHLVRWKAGWLISWVMLGIGGLNMIELSDMRGIIDIGILARTKWVRESCVLSRWVLLRLAILCRSVWGVTPLVHLVLCSIGARWRGLSIWACYSSWLVILGLILLTINHR